MTLIEPRLGESLIRIAKNCDALYICPKDAKGKRLGPLVAYAGKSKDGKNLIGDIYFNFRRIEPHTAAVERFAQVLCERLAEQMANCPFDTVCGIPHGGRTLAQALARKARARFVYADKVPIPTEPGKKQEYVWDLSQFTFEPGEKLLVVEDVINNLQNTDNTLAQIAKTGATVTCLAAALNRSPFADKSYTPKSGPFEGKELPIVAAIREPYPEYPQNDPAVAADVTEGNVEFEVKKNWPKLVAAMEVHQAA
ncbi:MAG: phosphoribosyltransferase [Candidatus Taylorbacteria bacterium]|nr:phosphoribosyltransferase [Candidatus Taylorbacteria bacterium]